MTSSFKNTTINDTGYIQIASGTIGQRPNYIVATFTSVGSTTWTCPSNVLTVEVLVVAGGGGGASRHPGGGGAGGVIYNSAFSVTPGTQYTVTIGAGGAGKSLQTNLNGDNGSNSVFGSLTALGGGGGGSYTVNGLSGGSGGGGGEGSITSGGSATQPGSGSGGFGNAGGGQSSSSPTYGGGGGGGGAGGAGQSSRDGAGGFGGGGGSGLSFGISGTPTYYAGGGGGAAYNIASIGLGGIGGGGNGVLESATPPNGAANTGGGGGANATGTTISYFSGTGGSGIVIIRYSSVATFTTTGTTSWTAPAGVYNVEALIVAGGGGGGGNNSGGQTPQGGGGGGGVIYQTFYSVTPGTSYTVTVGAGGAGGTSGSNAGANGGNSVFDTLTAVGGGSTSGGGGTSGGSGGGARNGSGGAGTAGQGFAGGNATGGANAAGGGGGAGSLGASGGTINGGAGGSGIDVNISGAIRSYGGGGGGGAYGGIPGQGGEGGGGAGGANSVNGVAGTANTGSGGGGAGSGGGGAGGAGGSGIVILRWATTGSSTVTTGMSRHNSALGEKEIYTASGWTSTNIVKDSLVVWLDAADNRSYSGSGTTWSDLSGNGNNGTLTNGPVYTADRSFTFDGSNDHVTLPAGNLWSGNGEHTFSAWVYINKLGLQMNIFDMGRAGDFLVLEDGGIRFHPVTSNYIETTNVKLLEKRWYHIALVQGPNYRTVYINGEPSGATVGGGSPYTVAWDGAGAQMRLGHAGIFRNYFNGRIAHVAIYGDTLTPAQINQNYHATKARFVSVGDANPYGTFNPNGLFIHYDFSNPACWPGYGPQVYDLVGTQNGIINGPKPGGVGMAKFFDFEKDIASHWIAMGSRIPYGQSTSVLTMEAWIFTESLAGGDGIGAIISSQYDTYQNGASINTDARSAHGGGPNGYHFQLGVNSVWTTQGSDGNSGSGTAEFSGRWDHIVATRASNGTKYIYENGVLLGSEGTYAGTMNWANVFWNLGCQNFVTGSTISSGGTQRFYDGKIAVARIYNRALDASDVLYNYNGQKNRFGL